jgi:hypothetical protein
MAWLWIVAAVLAAVVAAVVWWARHDRQHIEEARARAAYLRAIGAPPEDDA